MNEGALCDESAVSWECITPAHPYLNAESATELVHRASVKVCDCQFPIRRKLPVSGAPRGL